METSSGKSCLTKFRRGKKVSRKKQFILREAIETALVEEPSIDSDLSSGM